jgi:hypothetical protein
LNQDIVRQEFGSGCKKYVEFRDLIRIEKTRKEPPMPLYRHEGLAEAVFEEAKRLGLLDKELIKLLKNAGGPGRWLVPTIKDGLMCRFDGLVESQILYLYDLIPKEPLAPSGLEIYVDCLKRLTS